MNPFYFAIALGAMAVLGAISLWHRARSTISIENAASKDELREKETKAELVKAEATTETAKEAYDKAMADLPPDYKPPTG